MTEEEHKTCKALTARLELMECQVRNQAEAVQRIQDGYIRTVTIIREELNTLRERTRIAESHREQDKDTIARYNVAIETARKSLTVIADNQTNDYREEATAALEAIQYILT